MTPAMASGPGGSAMSSVSGSSSRSTWSSVSAARHRCAVRTMIRPSVTAAGVEGVDGLAQLEHHVVAGVHDVGDGPHAGREEAPLDREGRRPDASRRRRSGPRSAGSSVGVLDVDRQVVGGRVARLRRRVMSGQRSGAPVAAATSRARPMMDSASPRLGLTSTSSTTSPTRSSRGTPEGRLGGQDEDAVGVGGEAQLVARSRACPGSRRRRCEWSRCAGRPAAPRPAGPRARAGRPRCWWRRRRSTASARPSPTRDRGQREPVGVGVRARPRAARPRRPGSSRCPCARCP